MTNLDSPLIYNFYLKTVDNNYLIIIEEILITNELKDRLVVININLQFAIDLVMRYYLITYYYYNIMKYKI